MQRGCTVRSGADFSRNNLDCLRLILASVVVLFHISLTNVPALAFDRYFSARFAVDAFFVISGLLIYRSYVRSSSVGSYFEKRVRRIYPAYFTVVVLAALALCPLSSLPVSQYFGVGFWKYLGANLVFLNFLAPSLPGVFTSNSISAVNGALWTLKIEVAFYLFVPIIHWICSRLGTKKVMVRNLSLFLRMEIWLRISGLACTGRASTFSLDGSRSIYDMLEVQFPAQLMYFCAGILLLLYFDKLKIHFRPSLASRRLCFFSIISSREARLMSYGSRDWFSSSAFGAILGTSRSTATFRMASISCTFPIVQTMISFGLATRLNPVLFVLLDLSLVALASVLMWHLVEKRFLAGSSHYRQGSNR